MTVRKNPAGGWICELYPNGAKGKRIRKKFATKGEALAFEQYTVQKSVAGGKGRQANAKGIGRRMV